MRITYKTLKELIDLMDEDQLNSDLTVEVDGECYSAELCIATDLHGSLDPGHPAILAHTTDEDHERYVYTPGIAIMIGLGDE